MVKIIKQLQNPEFNFVLLGKWDLWGRYEKGKIAETKQINPVDYSNIDKEIWKPLGKAPFQSKWQTKGLIFNSKEVLAHENNIGIIGGYGRLRILDIDDESLGEALEDKMNTFTIKTGSGGKHFYFYSDWEENKVLINGLGELRCKNYQVVTIPSRHPNGNPYALHIDKPIRTIEKKELLSLVGNYLKQDKEISQVKTIENDTSRSALEYRKVLALLREGKSKEEIFKKMEAYSKWVGSPEAYKQLTFEKAKEYLSMEGAVATEDPLDDLDVFSDEELMNYEPPEQKWLIENQIPKGEVGLLVGKRGERKSFIAQIQAICGASQQPVFQDEVKEKFKVLWIDEEMGKDEIAKRTKILKKGLGVENALEIKYISRTGLKLDKKDTQKFKKFKELFLEYKPDLCVVDCLQRVVSFECDKDNASISELFTGVVRPLIKATGSTFYFIHHLRKSPSGNYKPEDPLDEVRGGSELVNYCRFVLMAQTPKYQTKTSEGGEMVLFRVLKMSNAQMPDPKVISFTNIEDSLVVKYEGVPEEVLAGEVQSSKAIKEFLFSEQIIEFRTKDILDNSEKIGFKQTLLKMGLNCLVKQGYLSKIGRGKYEVVGKSPDKEQKTLSTKQDDFSEDFE